jgi:uncharacterized protein DUF6968
MSEIVATTTLDCVNSRGEHNQVIVEIGRPYKAEGEWACPVAMRGLHNSLPDVRGEDSLQALCLAASLVRMLLTGFVEDGGKIFFLNSDSEYDLDATFSNVGSCSAGGPV